MPRPLAFALLAAATTYASAWLSYSLTLRSTGVVAIWLPSGLVLALLVLLEKRYWMAVLAGTFLANLAVDLQHDASVGLGVAGAAANGIESLLAALVLVRLGGPRITLGRLREVAALVAGAVILSNAFTSLLGAVVLSHGALEMFWRRWFTWWSGDGMGMLVIAPVVLTWVDAARSPKRVRWPAVAEALVVFGALAVVAYSLLLPVEDTAGILGGRRYLAFPLLLWSAVRFGPWGASTAVLILAVIATWHSSRYSPGPPLGGPASFGPLLEYCFYLALAALSSLIPASILSESRRTERDLRESEGRFRQMAEAIKEAFLVLDVATGRPLYVSPVWADIWGRPLAEAYRPEVWFEAIHEDDRAAVRTSMAAAAQGNAVTTVVRIRRPDGAMRWLRRRMFPVRDEAGRVYRLAGVSEDITALRQAEERFVQAQKMEAIGQLTGGVAHDFNNMLTVVMSHSEILLADLAEGDPRREDVEAIRRAGESAARLTRQLLIFSRQQVVQFTVLRLNDAVMEAIRLLARVLGANIELTTAFAPDTGIVKADAGQLEQLVMNLAVNARDAMPLGGKLLFESKNVTFGDTSAEAPMPAPPGRYVMLAVTDTGTGMTADTKARAFDPFFTTKEKGKGTGLGLATVYGIVAQSGGHIALYSEPGQGTTFKLYFPRVDGEAGGAAAALSATEVPRGTETILCVEDDPAVRVIVTRTLERLGYRVLEAPNGESALTLAARHRDPIHLLVTDVVLPGIGGRAVADNFCAQRSGAKVLFLSGYTDDSLIQHRVLEAEMHFLGKPFTPEVLARQVRLVLDSPTPSAPPSPGPGGSAPDAAR